MWLVVLAAAGLVGSGCARTTIEHPLDTNYPGADTGAELEFWHALPARPVVSNDEGLHGLILLALGQDSAGAYDARVALAKQEGWLAPDFDEPADLAMQRGTLARAITVILDIKGGLMMHLLGPTARYSTRELVYLQLLSEPSTENLVISGLEYVGVISKAQDYRALHAPRPGPEAPNG